MQVERGSAESGHRVHLAGVQRQRAPAEGQVVLVKAGYALLTKVQRIRLIHHAFAIPGKHRRQRK